MSQVSRAQARRLLSLGAAAPVLYQAPVTVTQHPAGLPHVRSTIKKMAALARAGSHSYPIRNLATRITSGVASKDYRGEVAAIYMWVRDTVRYRKDPDGLEWVQSPARTVQELAGDCDDQAVLIAALVGALGHRWHFDTVGPSATVQKHVAAVADLETGSVVLDPVLEPPQATPAARTDLGTFGLRAHGVHHTWTAEGKMLGFMGSVVDARERALWDWNAYYPPTGAAARASGFQRPQGGAFTTPAWPYHMHAAPGWHGTGRPLASMPRLSPQQGALSGDDLGFSLLRLIKGVGKGIGKGVHIIGKLARNPIVQAGVNVVAPGAGAAVAKAGQYEGRAEQVIRDVRHGGPAALLRALPIPSAAGQLIAQAGAAALTAAQRKPHPELARKYPKGAQQVFDPRHNIFRVYVRGKKKSGLHGIRPSLSFSLGASSASSANAAIAAVRSYIGQFKKAPTVPVAAVRAFQSEDGALTVDGKWGPNSRKAAAWYLGAPEQSMPPVAAAFSGTKITWHPPAAPTHAAAPARASAPVHRAAPAAPATHAAAAPRAAPPAAIPPAPLPGYTEVGHENANPGLQPIAAPSAAQHLAPPAPPETPGVLPSVTLHPVTAPKKKKAKPAVVTVAAKKAAAKKPLAHKKLTPVAITPGAVTTITPIDVSLPSPAAAMPQAPMSAGPGLPGASTAEYAVTPSSSGGGGDNKALWLAIGYLYYKQQQRKRSAAA
jgi:hypothetical protein